jgi:hypothetical protein
MDIKTALVGLTLAAMAGACDDRPAITVPPDLGATTVPAEPEPATRPTTQSLLSGPRKAIALDVLPFTLTVPAGWALQPPVAGMVVLGGVSPSGDILIQLNTRTISTESIPYIETGAKEQQKSDPKTYRVAASRMINGTKVFERQELRHVKMPDGSPILTWTITAYINRAAKESSVYELNFVGLSDAHFQADKDFLYSIINSLQYVPADDKKATTR